MSDAANPSASFVSPPAWRRRSPSGRWPMSRTSAPAQSTRPPSAISSSRIPTTSGSRTSAISLGPRSISMPMSRARDRRSCPGLRRRLMLDITTGEPGATEPSTSPDPVFTLEQVATYRRQGWLLARGFIPAPEVAALVRWTDELVARPEEPGKHMVYREASLRDPGRQVIQRIENFCPYHAAYDAFVRNGRLCQAVDQLLDEPVCLFKEKINFKMPGGAGFEPHQDQQAGWSRYARMF